MKKPTRKMVDLAAEQGSITALWALAMLDYRGKVGDYAWDRMREMNHQPSTWVQAIAFLTGYAASGAGMKPDRLWDLVPKP